MQAQICQYFPIFLYMTIFGVDKNNSYCDLICYWDKNILFNHRTNLLSYNFYLHKRIGVLLNLVQFSKFPFHSLMHYPSCFTSNFATHLYYIILNGL